MVREACDPGKAPVTVPSYDEAIRQAFPREKPGKTGGMTNRE